MEEVKSIRESYATLGVKTFYEKHGQNYSNPHESSIHKCLDAALAIWKPNLSNVLDLACGSGEITSYLKATNIVGIDPYTHEAYYKRTGKNVFKYTFEDIATGAISDHRYSLIVCSFALHLVDQSRLPTLCLAIGQLSPNLLILTPNKKPIISHGWDTPQELYIDRVRARYYNSTCYS